MIFATPGHCLRLARAGFVMAREGVFSNIDPALAPPAARLPLALARLIARRNANGLAAAMARLGPSYVKLGQFLATRADIIGPAAVRQLELLQDRMAPFGRDAAVAQIEAAFGKKLDEVFVEFGEPVAAASVAQVHRATVQEGAVRREVAVKVIRPGVEKRFARDLSDMYFAARLAERFLKDSKRLRPVEVVDVLARSVKMEMDFRLEAAAASEFAQNTADDPHFRVPEIDWDRTAKDVLTLEWIDGVPLSDRTALEVSGQDLPALGRRVIQSFLQHAVRDGFFHADMHQGNLFLDPAGTLIAVDFGIMGRLGLKERRFLAEILFGFITRDYARVARVHFEAGYVPGNHSVEDFAQAIRAVGEPIHARTADEISMARVLTLLFEITALFDMKTRTELVMLQKTMVVVEGVARTLDPQLNMWAVSEPVVRTWIEENLGPMGKLRDAGAGIAGFGGLFGSLPGLVARGLSVGAALEEAVGRGFTVSAESLEGIGRAEARRAFWGNAALWVIAGLLAWMVWR